MNDNQLKLLDLGRGLSGCSLKISNNGNLIKKSSSIKYNDRLIKQSEKQKYFQKLNISNIKIPKIFNNNYENDLFNIEMEYIYAENEINFFSHASVSQIDNFIETIKSYLTYISKDSYQYNFSEKIFNKLDSLKINTNYPEIVLKLLSLVERKDILLPYSICHGDLTLANILFKEKTLFFIDFLDSYVDSFYCDVIKLKQDLYYFWNLNLNKSQNLRIKIIYQKLWCEIYKIYSDELKSQEFKLLDIINFLRIEPYLKSSYHRKLIDCIILKLKNEF